MYDEIKTEYEPYWTAARQDFDEKIRKASKASGSEKSEEGETKNTELINEIEEIKTLEDANVFSIQDWIMTKNASTP